MYDIQLRTSQAIPTTVLEEKVAALFGRVTTSQRAWEGDPREGYYRRWELVARAEAVEVLIRFSESSRFPSSTEPPDTSRLGVDLRGAGAREAAAALEGALAPLGYVTQSVWSSEHT